MAGATVERGATVGARTVLFPGAYVGEGAQVGEDCVLHPNVTVRDGCMVGARVHPPRLVGGRRGRLRLRVRPRGRGPEHFKIPQAGIVRIEDDVEIGACSCVDRATLGETVVGRGTKIDNLVQVAHNVKVGPLVPALRAGRDRRLDASWAPGVVLAGQVGVVGHLKVGDMAKVGAQSGVAQDVPDGAVRLRLPGDRPQGVAARRPRPASSCRSCSRRCARSPQGSRRSRRRGRHDGHPARSRSSCRTATRSCWWTAWWRWSPGRSWSAYKNVTINEPFFNGHFPGHPVMPGVLILEALAQASAILAYKSEGDGPDASKVTYLMAIDNAKFRKPVVPGDRLQLEVEVVKHKGAIWKRGARPRWTAQRSPRASSWPRWWTSDAGAAARRKARSMAKFIPRRSSTPRRELARDGGGRALRGHRPQGEDGRGHARWARTR